MSAKTAALIVASVLIADGGMHLLWATGSTWPADGTRKLSRGLLNIDRTEPFPAAGLLSLAGILFGTAAMVLTRAGYLGSLGHQLPAALPTVATAALATGVLVRTVAGAVWITGFGTDTSAPFYRLNLLAYTPMCLLLLGGSVLVLRS